MRELLDRSRYGADTLLAHELMRGAVLRLHRWGLLSAVVEAGTPPVRSTTFHLPDADTMSIELTAHRTRIQPWRPDSVGRFPESVAATSGIRSCCRCPPAARCFRLDPATTVAN